MTHLFCTGKHINRFAIKIDFFQTWINAEHLIFFYILNFFTVFTAMKTMLKLIKGQISSNYSLGGLHVINHSLKKCLLNIWELQRVVFYEDLGNNKKKITRD